MNNHQILTEQEFENLRQIVLKSVGIRLREYKIYQLSHFIGNRINELKLTSFIDYINYLAIHVQEVEQLINYVSNTWTYFFREPSHFEYLVKKVLPEICKVKKQLRVWSVGCATGEEPYSIAMTILDFIGKTNLAKNYDVKILASDVNTEALNFARHGIYEPEKIEDLGLWRKWFKPHFHNNMICAKVDERLKSIIRFRYLNLLDHWPMKNSFDIIFCRNVSLYFPPEEKKRLFERLDSYLDVNGILVIGFFEDLSAVNDKYTLLQHKIYRKIKP